MPIIPQPPTAIRQQAPVAPPPLPPATFNIPQNDNSQIDPATGAMMTEGDDGSILINFSPSGPRKSSKKFDENLADGVLGEYELNSIATDLFNGIDADIRSRSEWEMAYSRGLDLLGLKMEDASSEATANGTVSKVFHPLLLEAVVRYQSNESGEMLPSSGPVKVRDDEPMGDEHRVMLAEALEKDFNHYLTVVAKEYYPDFERMLFQQGYGGNGFRKIYRCPVRKRPVSEMVQALDLIVSNDATNLENAARITHRVMMRNSMVKRMMAAKVYRKIDLSQPVEQPSQAEENKNRILGIQSTPELPADYRHTIYECYTELNIPGLEETDDIPVPYRITLDLTSRKILELRRDWKEDDEDFRRRRHFVKYGLIPGLGFYDFGYIHLLGNTTRALTAIERQLLDAGQFANFPGFLLAGMGARQETSDIRISPGSGKYINTGGLPISQVAMPLPYKEPSGVLATIAEKIAQDGQRLGGTAEINVGEGRADVPVGTMVAMIEQATKVLSAVHKRNHVTQQEEFEIMKELFAEDPQALWKFAKKPARKWEMAEEFSDIELVPASDPNVPSHIHRIMQATALVQLAQAAPHLYNLPNISRRVLHTIGVEDVESLMAPPGQSMPGQQQQGTPVDPSKMAKVQLDAAAQQREAQQAVLEGQIRMKELEVESQDRTADRESREKIAGIKFQEERMRAQENTLIQDRKLKMMNKGIGAGKSKKKEKKNG